MSPRTFRKASAGITVGHLEPRFSAFAEDNKQGVLLEDVTEKFEECEKEAKDAISLVKF
jgi:hypothetical protein